MAKEPKGSNDDVKAEQTSTPEENPKLVTMEELGIGPRDPYPTADSAPAKAKAKPEPEEEPAARAKK